MSIGNVGNVDIPYVHIQYDSINRLVSTIRTNRDIVIELRSHASALYLRRSNLQTDCAQLNIRLADSSREI